MILKPFLFLIILFGLLACLATAAPYHDCQCSQHKGFNGGRGLNARSPILPPPWPPGPEKKVEKYREDDTLIFWDGKSKSLKCLVTSSFVDRSKSPPQPFFKSKIVDAVKDPKSKSGPWKCPKGEPVKKTPKKGLNARSPIKPPPPPPIPPWPSWPPSKVEKYREDAALLFKDGRRFKCVVESFFVDRQKWLQPKFSKYKIVIAVHDPNSKLHPWKCPTGGGVMITPEQTDSSKMNIDWDEMNRLKSENKINGTDINIMHEIHTALGSTELKIKQLSKSPPTINVKFINKGPYTIRFGEDGSPMDKHAFENGLFVILANKMNLGNGNKWSQDIVEPGRQNGTITLKPNQTVEQDVVFPGKTIPNPEKWLAVLKDCHEVKVKMRGVWVYMSVNDTADGIEYEDRKADVDFNSNMIELDL
ncbi:hypothetical protein ACKAV7_011000 [Fusarium commune]